MSVSEIKMPQLGLTMTEGRVVEWHVAVGDAVKAGQVVVTIESEKTQEEVESDIDGTLTAILSEADATVPIGTVIGTVEA